MSNQPLKIRVWYLHADLSDLEKEPSYLLVEIIWGVISLLIPNFRDIGFSNIPAMIFESIHNF